MYLSKPLDKTSAVVVRAAVLGAVWWCVCSKCARIKGRSGANTMFVEVIERGSARRNPGC